MILTVVAVATDDAKPSPFFGALASELLLHPLDVEILVIQGPSGPVRTAPAGVKVLTLDAAASIFELWGAGVRRAQADAVALLDVRCPPRPGWFAAVREALPLSASAIFGPVACSIPKEDSNVVGYLTEYVQFDPPVDPALREVPGINLIAAKPLLLDQRVLREDGLVKTRFLARLEELGLPLPSPIENAIVEYQKSYDLAGYMMHRYRHGRCYAAQRPLRALPGRVLAVLTTPCLPVLRSWRIYRSASRDSANARVVRRFWFRIGLAEAAWSLGEFLGYTLGEGRARHRLR